MSNNNASTLVDTLKKMADDMGEDQFIAMANYMYQSALKREEERRKTKSDRIKDEIKELELQISEAVVKINDFETCLIKNEALSTTIQYYINKNIVELRNKNEERRNLIKYIQKRLQKALQKEALKQNNNT